MSNAFDGSQPLGIDTRLKLVLQRIERASRRAGRNPGEVTLVAVSKRVPASAVAEAARLGQTIFGESYVQEALAKYDALAGLGLSWHFIGGLQKNKAKYLPGKFSLVHSVDNFDVAHILHLRSSALGLVQDILLQVSLAGETQKGGVAPLELDALAERVAALTGTRLLGLMVLPPYDPDPEFSRPYFARLRRVRDDLEAKLEVSLPHLSMGMSGDLETAVEEGATLVRVGTDIFGPRT